MTLCRPIRSLMAMLAVPAGMLLVLTVVTLAMRHLL